MLCHVAEQVDSDVLKDLSTAIFRSNIPSDLKIKVLRCFETSGTAHTTTEDHITQD